jgi:hypothetical protein
MSTFQFSLNPFVYGKPVPPDRIVGRRDAVQTLFSRLFNGESTAIVGEPHIGKSSLLRYLAEEDVWCQWLGEISEQQICIEIDCEMLTLDFAPISFWKIVLERVSAVADGDELKQQCEIVKQNDFGSFTLEALFKLLAKQERRVVLLIDEFDALLNHPNFNKAEFFGALRSFATRTDGLAIITASRLSVAQMNHKSQELNPYGSPFFNNSIEVRLLPFERNEAKQLIEVTLTRGNNAIKFSDADYNWLFSLAGGQPFLLQVAGASLYDAMADGTIGDARYSKATALFHQRADAHFADFWRSLNDDEKRALFLLALREFGSWIVDKHEFDWRQLNKLDRFAPELRHLRDLGIVESGKTQGAVYWGDGSWRVSSAGIVTWLMENVVAGLRTSNDFNAIRGMEFLGPLTRDEISKIQEIAKKIPPSAGKMAFDFVKSLFGK